MDASLGNKSESDLRLQGVSCWLSAGTDGMERNMDNILYLGRGYDRDPLPCCQLTAVTFQSSAGLVAMFASALCKTVVTSQDKELPENHYVFYYPLQVTFLQDGVEWTCTRHLLVI